MMSGQLQQLVVGQIIPFGGGRFTTVTQELADSFSVGDHLVIVQQDGALLHVPRVELEGVDQVIGGAQRSFTKLAACSDQQITDFYDTFATLLADDTVFAGIAAANHNDVHLAQQRQRSTTRLVLSETMRRDMVAGVRVWRDVSQPRTAVEDTVHHPKWTVTTSRAPLGIVGFVFEGRPNVFADATGVLRSGNCAVLRIGSDALGTAKAIMRLALRPALSHAGLPTEAVGLIDSPAHAAGWALFSDQRLSLAVARGSGAAVAQLGAVARQSGIPASLHGAGGSWMAATGSADLERFADSVLHSLDRKVCNTLNVCCIERAHAAVLVPVFISSVLAAANRAGTSARVHVVDADADAVDDAHYQTTVAVQRADGVHIEPFVSAISMELLAHEWEWESSPEVSLVLVDDLEHMAQLFNRYSPRLAASLISDDPNEHQLFAQTMDAPFIGDGMTRWVDGLFALHKPELGLSNWANGRLFARSAVLSGDSVFTRRLHAHVTDYSLRR